ncbi:hypothetical protein [Streptomyces sp. 891-h]|uniref:hypothetical protein n=1 Tax=Streptomyces sp. 891-h TaxID=2720714 RepID=UPI001FA9F8A5|nr:hypothetical protein [Streptomyces sp. 891-h]UNZ20644.1 hypothetical protein HC362_29835 [Streptomyces sp. 891-h]
MSDCAAYRRGCGTPNGWRKGGRCWRCRAAHNAETRKYRGLTPEQRSDFLAARRAGESVDQAAARVGVTRSALSNHAVTDGELRAAIDGLPETVQKAAQMGDYLAALTRTGGAVSLSMTVTGLSAGALERYRRADPHFAAAEEAVLKWLDQLTVVPQNAVTQRRLDMAVQVLKEGGTISAAAAKARLSITHLRSQAARHPQLAAVLPPPRRRGGRPKRTMSAAQEQQLREMWTDLSFTVTDVHRRLGVSYAVMRRWADELELDPRPVAKRGKQPRRRGARQHIGTALSHD